MVIIAKFVGFFLQHFQKKSQIFHDQPLSFKDTTLQHWSFMK